MVNPISINIRPLTPIWTGDANGKGGSVRETGVLGSLRWWYEALLRGLGHHACDPSKGICVFDKNKRRSSICLACQVFGCTGFSRRFRLSLEGGNGTGQVKEIKLEHPGNTGHRGWRIPASLTSPLSLTFLPSVPGGIGEFEMGTLFYTLRLMERYGALGAKTSLGQGAISVTDWGALVSPPSFDDWKAMLRSRAGEPHENPSSVPDLADFVGATITFDPTSTSENRWWDKLPLTDLKSFGINNKSTWVPAAPALRAHVRGWLRNSANFSGFNGNLRNERHRLMGSIRNPVGPKGSDIFVTHLYRSDIQLPWMMRIFGFIPRNGNEVDQAMRNLLRNETNLATEIKAALNGIPIELTPYPDQIAELLINERR